MILTPISDEEIGKTKEILVDKEEQDKVYLRFHNMVANFFI